MSTTPDSQKLADTLDAVVCDHVEVENCRVCLKGNHDFGFAADDALAALAEQGLTLVKDDATLHVVMLSERFYDGNENGHWERSRPVFYTFDERKAHAEAREWLSEWPITHRWDDYRIELETVKLNDSRN